MDVGSPEAFAESGTLGVEEEFFVVDERGVPTAGSDELVYEGDPPELLDGRVDHELFKFVVETQTPKLDGPGEAAEAIEEVRAALVAYAEEYDYRIAAAGLHPGARWREHEHAEKPRYRSQLDRIQYPQHRNTTAGLHVHVGVDDPDKAVWVANRLRWHTPVMLALSANSPYWNGFDTGLASARAKIFEGLPNTGMPTAFDSFEAYQNFERRMVEHGSIADRGELWYDVRPHSGHGTVEVRAPDAQADPDVVSAFVEYSHALVTDYADRYEDHPDPFEVDGLRRELLDENKWRATRHGHESSFVTRDGTGTVDLGEVVDRECERLGVSGIRDVYDAASGSERQRRLLDERGERALYESLVL
ncbi:glutamate--cysteine ligase [Halobacterium jilantaiense]|uniref:Glutamate--cysteine ligase n=1 Tax=Halobacterium jilantaiense TaxID=355548 RepID=A0A1I0QTE2_9EURY|nr:glutamate--cysteine ligase [Halobacterium jilantaiense]SEW30701.1 carboxylate-amine ligase [Halobacterium jilantaiense]